MKAMILAAGRGERMRPLTDTTPKPLAKVGNTTLIDHMITQLCNAGVREFVINVHHLRDQIMQHCGDGSRYNARIDYSIEETLLETGGGILKALPLLGDHPFIIASSDVWTDFPFSTFIHKKISLAHLVLVNNPAYHSTGDFGLSENNFIVNNSEKKFTYASFGVLHPDLFQGEKPGIFKLSKVLLPAIDSEKVTGEYYRGVWHNIGTIAELDALKS